jgi:hypothetical protein
MKLRHKKVMNVFLDFRAAYDTVETRILWTVLYHKFYMPLNLIRVIRDLFDYNESFFLIGSKTSTAIANLRGVPQARIICHQLLKCKIKWMVLARIVSKINK